MSSQDIDTDPPILWITPKQYRKSYNVSQAQFYRQLKAGLLETVLLSGSMRRISVASADRLFASAGSDVRPGPMSGRGAPK